jgi:hypothetical protein
MSASHQYAHATSAEFFDDAVVRDDLADHDLVEQGGKLALCAIMLCCNCLQVNQLQATPRQRRQRSYSIATDQNLATGTWASCNAPVESSVFAIQMASHRGKTVCLRVGQHFQRCRFGHFSAVPPLQRPASSEDRIRSRLPESSSRMSPATTRS